MNWEVCPMRYKTSWFNPTLAKNSLRRFWPLPLGVLAYYLLILVFPLYDRLKEAADPRQASLFILMDRVCDSYVNTTLGYQLLSLGGICFVSAILLFRHLHSRKEIQFYLGLPLKRRSLYVTLAVMGYLMVLLPMLLAQVIALAVSASFGSSVLPIFKLMGAGLSACTLFYGMAVLACILAGQSFGSVLVYGGMNCAALAILAGAGTVVSSFLLGFGGTSTLAFPRAVQWLTPALMLFQKSFTYYDAGQPTLLTTPMPLVVYGILGAVLLLLSGVLYVRRRGETAGEMLAFGPVKVLCKILAALAVSMGLTFMLYGTMDREWDISFAALLAMVLIFTAVGWIAAEMVIQKSFRVFRKKVIAQGGCLLLAIGLLMCAGKADFFGYVRRIPDPEKVSTAMVYQDGDYAEVSPEDATALHETILQNTDVLLLRPGSFYNTLRFRYMMKNGAIIERSYYIKAEEVPNAISNTANALFSKPENNWQIWFNWEGDLTVENFENAVLWDSAVNDTVPSFTATDAFTPGLGDTAVYSRQEYALTREDALTLYDAILADIEEGNLEPRNYIHPMDYVGSDGYLGRISFTRYQRTYDSEKETYSHYLETVPSSVATVDLYEDMENTVKALEEIGFEVHIEGT